MRTLAVSPDYVVGSVHALTEGGSLLIASASGSQLGSLVHVPEPALPRGGLSRGRRGEGVRVDAGQREMPEREPHVPAQLLFDLLDCMERLPRVRALVVVMTWLQRQRGGEFLTAPGRAEVLDG